MPFISQIQTVGTGTHRAQGDVHIHALDCQANDRKEPRLKSIDMMMKIMTRAYWNKYGGTKWAVCSLGVLRGLFPMGMCVNVEYEVDGGLK